MHILSTSIYPLYNFKTSYFKTSYSSWYKCFICQSKNKYILKGKKYEENIIFKMMYVYQSLFDNSEKCRNNSTQHERFG